MKGKIYKHEKNSLRRIIRGVISCFQLISMRREMKKAKGEEWYQENNHGQINNSVYEYMAHN